MTFDPVAEAFECPHCRGYCNCTICSRRRGEEYIPERDGGWRAWIARQGGAYRPAAAATSKKNISKDRETPPARKLRARTTTNTTTDSQRFDSSWSATAVFTVSGQPLGHAILQGNEARIVPVPQATVTLPVPPAATTTATLATYSTPEAPPKPQQPQKRRHVFIGKPLKTWGRVVSLPDPEPDQPEPKRTTKGKGKTTARGGRAGRRGKRTRLYVGSLEPLLAARKRQRQPASLSDANAGHDGDEDADIDADGDTDDGVWPGEYVVPTIVVTEPDAEPEMVGARITPEEVERAIGAAFAFGAAA